MVPLFSQDLGAVEDISPKSNAAAWTGPKKRVYLQFDDELVAGKYDSPAMDYIFIKKQANFKKLLKLRENFIPEVKKGKRDFSGVR